MEEIEDYSYMPSQLKEHCEYSRIGGKNMSTTKPIKNLKELERLKNYYLKQAPNLRNFTLICIGINTALRISDIRLLKWNDVYDFSTKQFREHIVLTEQKTKKLNSIAINKNLKQALSIYKKSKSVISPNSYLFTGNGRSTPISRSQAFRIIRKAAEKVNITEPVSCHSLRKTFGYHAWRTGIAPVIIMHIYNHSSFQITKRYLGIDQDDKDAVFRNVNL